MNSVSHVTKNERSCGRCTLKGTTKEVKQICCVSEINCSEPTDCRRQVSGTCRPKPSHENVVYHHITKISSRFTKDCIKVQYDFGTWVLGIKHTYQQKIIAEKLLLKFCCAQWLIYNWETFVRTIKAISAIVFYSLKLNNNFEHLKQ